MDDSDERKGHRRGNYHEYMATRRVLAPFLPRVRRKSQFRLTEIKEEYQNVYLQTQPWDVLNRLNAYFKDPQELHGVLNETSEIMRIFTKSQAATLYLADSSQEYIYVKPKVVPDYDRNVTKYRIEPGTTVAAYAAHIQQHVASNDILGDPRFPEGVAGAGKLVKSVLCLPVLTSADPAAALLGVIELYRDVYQEPYTQEDVQMATATTGWMGAAIQQSDEKVHLMKEGELNKHLLSLLQLLFSGVIPFDRFISDIVRLAKATVGGERGSFYVMSGNVVEGTDDEILADVYEEGIDSYHASVKKKTKQRFTKNAPGLAGHVARCGRIINIQDAYADKRFNKASDVLGFRSRSVIVVPIKSSINVLGALKLVNKNPAFNAVDERLLLTFAAYCVLACQFDQKTSQLRQTVSRSEGNVEILKYHMRPCSEELSVLVASPVLPQGQMPKGYYGFDWFLGGLENYSPHYVIHSILACTDAAMFRRESLCEFVLMVKKSYRHNPYHNFVHAFTVFHCMFNVLNRNMATFTKLERAALLIAAITHDVDHFGRTNSFLNITDNWLAELYEESSLEHHHVDICMMLIEISQLLKPFTEEDRSFVTKLIEAVILATDLPNHFRSRGAMTYLLKSGTFDLGAPEHRLLFMDILITTCDISGQCKPYDVAKFVTDCLYKEFYKQGDEEKSLGLTPLPIMDRDQIDQIPLDQIRFLTVVCIPCLEILVAILPNAEPLLQMCLQVKDVWKAESLKEPYVWRPEEAFPAPRRQRTLHEDRPTASSIRRSAASTRPSAASTRPSAAAAAESKLK